MKKNIKYMYVFLVLLVIEIVIAVFVHDAIIRPYIGDILVVILIYALIRGIAKKSIKFLPIYIFVFATAVEFAQYFHIIEILHLENNKLMRTIIGTSFAKLDILCYLIATGILIVWENIEKQK
jgi:hypothetical protein